MPVGKLFLRALLHFPVLLTCMAGGVRPLHRRYLRLPTQTNANLSADFGSKPFLWSVERRERGRDGGLAIDLKTPPRAARVQDRLAQSMVVWR